MPDDTGIWEKRQQLIDVRNERVAAVYAEYDEKARAEDAAFDAVFDAARAKYEVAKARIRPDHKGLQNKRDEALQAAERELDDALRALYVEAGVPDSRYT
jgi:hypothetical protein